MAGEAKSQESKDLCGDNPQDFVSKRSTKLAHALGIDPGPAVKGGVDWGLGGDYGWNAK